MGLADGDLYVSGSILSFQQMIRVYTNFRAASVPSALQAGALWSKSTDDRLYHQGASALLEVYTEKSGTLFENLISNSGFGVGSRSVLTDIDDQISVSDIASGVCTSGDTKNLQVGDLIKFNGGGTTGTTVYEVTALVADTNFTINDTSITDGTAVTCDEATPAFTAADAYAPEIWTKTTTLDLYRWFNHATYHKGMYGLKVIKGVNGAEYLYSFGGIASEDFHYLRYRGKTVTFGCWVYSVTAVDNVKLQINDSTGTTESSFVAADTLTWVEITRTCGASITSFTPRILFDGDTADEAYISQPMLIFGSSIGEGNYQPKQQELIWVDKYIESTKLNAYSNQSTQGAFVINIEADSDGKLPKGVRSLNVFVQARDAGSAAGACYIFCRADSAIGGQFYVSMDGIRNDASNYFTGPIKCSGDGDYEYRILATGAGTLDVQLFRYIGIQVN